MTTKRTPGDWVTVIDRNSDGEIVHAGIDTADRSVQVGSVCLENIDAECDDQVVADCNMFAAAPRLLDACRVALWYYQNFRESSPKGETEISDMASVVAAIELATGEPHAPQRGFVS